MSIISVLSKSLHLSTQSTLKLENIFLKLTKYYWILIGLAFLALAGLETSEFVLGISNTFHLSEIAIYFVLLWIVGLLIKKVLLASRLQQNAVNIINYKHNFSLELIPYQNWDSLVALLAKRLAEIVDARASYLSVLEPFSNEFEHIAEWRDENYSTGPSTKISCQVCIEKNLTSRLPPTYCEFTADQLVLEDCKSYCIPIFHKNSPYALIRFILKPGHVISDEQRQILENVSTEVIAALMAGQDRKKLSELELAKATLAERQAMSHYLHDNLGQNIGYLRMKLDQLANQPNSVLTDEGFKNELIGMKDIADQSYKLIRNKLEDSIPDSTPLLTNYLQEHARKVAQRSKIEINFTSQGINKPVSVELQRALFYVFQEALSNVEKHAKANLVTIDLDWGNDSLNITIKDNGKGFNINNISGNKHFGLEIMRERIAAIGGTVEICSAENSGTSVKINAPTASNKRLRILDHG